MWLRLGMSKSLVFVGCSELWDLILGHIIWKIYKKEWFLIWFKNGYRCTPTFYSMTGCHDCLIWTPLTICGVRWRGQCRKPGPAHFLNVLLATRQPHRRINYELVMQANTRPKMVPTVLHSPCPTPPPSSHLLLSWNPRRRVKPPSK
jgi:hypothetical protein